jgi:hypothetical protein
MTQKTHDRMNEWQLKGVPNGRGSMRRRSIASHRIELNLNRMKGSMSSTKPFPFNATISQSLTLSVVTIHINETRKHLAVWGHRSALSWTKRMIVWQSDVMTDFRDICATSGVGGSTKRDQVQSGLFHSVDISTVVE